MIDKTSYEILNILQKKARIPNVEVARLVGLAPSAVLERIRKLEKKGFIDGYEVRLNPEKFRHSLIVFIHIQFHCNKIEEISEALRQLPEVQEIHLVNGSDSLFLKARCEDNRALGQLLLQKIKPLPGVISTHSETVLHTIKETSRIPLPETPG